MDETRRLRRRRRPGAEPLVAIVAETRGRIGERLARIVADRWITFRELIETAADAAGARRPLWHIPTPIMETGVRAIEAVCRLLNVETRATMASLECSRRIPDMDTTKARTELGWQPRPIVDAIRDAVAFHLRRAGQPG